MCSSDLFATLTDQHQDQVITGTPPGAAGVDKDVSPLGGGEPYRFRVADYANLLKPRVMMLVVFTAVTGLVIAPGQIDLLTAVIATLCVAIGAGASGAINMW